MYNNLFLIPFGNTWGWGLEKIYLSFKPSNVSAASLRTIMDFEFYSRKLGFRVIQVDKRDISSLISAYRYIRKLHSKYGKIIILSLYPYIYGKNAYSYPSLLIKMMSATLTKTIIKESISILYAVDYPPEQGYYTGIINDKFYRYNSIVERDFLENTNYICVFNNIVKNWLKKKYNFKNIIFKEFKLLDYGYNIIPRINLGKYASHDFHNNIHIAWIGSIRIGRLIKILKNNPPKSLIIHFTGRNGDWINKLGYPNVVYDGFIPNYQKLTDFLSENIHFGIIFKESKYNEFGSTSKFSAYMLAGLPVLVQSNFKYLSATVKKYNVGIIFDELENIPEAISNFSDSEIRQMSKNAYNLGTRLKEGWFFTRTITDILREL